MEARGRGGLVRWGLAITRSGRRHTSLSGDGAPALDSALVLVAGAVLDGCHSGRVTGSILGGADTAAASDGQVEAGKAAGAAEVVGAAVTAVSHHCTTEFGIRT